MQEEFCIVGWQQMTPLLFYSKDCYHHILTSPVILPWEIKQYYFYVRSSLLELLSAMYASNSGRDLEGSNCKNQINKWQIYFQFYLVNIGNLSIPSL